MNPLRPATKFVGPSVRHSESAFYSSVTKVVELKFLQTSHSPLTITTETVRSSKTNLHRKTVISRSDQLKRNFWTFSNFPHKEIPGRRYNENQKGWGCSKKKGVERTRAGTLRRKLTLCEYFMMPFLKSNEKGKVVSNRTLVDHQYNFPSTETETLVPMLIYSLLM